MTGIKMDSEPLSDAGWAHIICTAFWLHCFKFILKYLYMFYILLITTYMLDTQFYFY